MTKNTTTTQTITEDSPSVLAYRVGQLELAVAGGLKEVKDELHELQRHYATKLELAEVRTQNHEEHERIWNELKRVDGDVVTVRKGVDRMEKANSSMSLVQKIVFAAVAIGLLAIANRAMDLIIH